MSAVIHYDTLGGNQHPICTVAEYERLAGNDILTTGRPRMVSCPDCLGLLERAGMRE